MQNDDTDSPRGPRHPYGVTNRQRDELGRIETEMREILGEAEPDSQRGPQRSDRDAIDDEYVFIRRFGFDWAKRDRVGLIAFKHRLDLTDREIRLLRWTGNLRRKNSVVTLAPTRWAAIFGRCLAVIAFLEFTVIMLLQVVTVHHALSALQTLKLYGATAFVLILVWLVHLGYVKPWVIEQRVMKKTAQ
jgi:hypothetical protein